MALRRKTGLVDPLAPVHLGNDSVHLRLVVGASNIRLPSRPELSSLNRCLLVVQNILPEESLEIVFSNQALQEGKELESLLIRNSTEGIVRRSSLESWVKGGINMVHSVKLHVGDHRDISKMSLDNCKFFSMKLTRDLTLFEDGEALIEPEVLPILAGEIISSP